MGSFNSVCGVSKAPIRPNDKVRLFFIVSNVGLETIEAFKHEDNLVRNRFAHRGLGDSSTDHFTVLGYPMKAEYDDCSTYSIDEDDAIMKYNLSVIRDFYEKVNSSDHPEEKYFDHFDIEAKDLNFDLVNDMIRDGALYVNSNYGAKCFLQLFPVLEDVYQILLQGKVNFYSRSGYNDLTLSQYVEYRHDERNKVLESYNEEFNLKFETYQPVIGSVNDDGTVFTTESAIQMSDLSAMISSEYYTIDDKNDWSFRRSTNYKNLLHIDGILDYHYETSFVIRALNTYNIEIVPTMTGKQDSEVHAHSAFLLNIGKVLYNRQMSEHSKWRGTPMSVIPEPFVEIHYDVLSDYFDFYWDDKVTDKGKESLEVLNQLYPGDSPVLTYSEACEQGLESLYHYVGTTMLSIKIVR